MNVKLFIQTLAKYGMTVSEEQAKDYEKLLRGESIPADKETLVKSDLAGLVEKIMLKDPEFAKSIKDIANKNDQPNAPDILSFPNLKLFHVNDIDFTYEWIGAISHSHEKGKILASAGDIYHYISKLCHLSGNENYSRVAFANKEMSQFREIYASEIGGNIITSTKLFSRVGTNTAEVVHYYLVSRKSSLAKKVILPKTGSAGEADLSSFLSNKQFGKQEQLFDFVQAILDTKDKEQSILSTIRCFFGNPQMNLFIEYPSITNFLESPVSLKVTKNCFCISYANKNHKGYAYTLD